MADRCCNYCNDAGDCPRCSYFFQPNVVHKACGTLWKDHKIQGNQFPYPPFAVCPS